MLLEEPAAAAAAAAASLRGIVESRMSSIVSSSRLNRCYATCLRALHWNCLLVPGIRLMLMF